MHRIAGIIAEERSFKPPPQVTRERVCRAVWEEAVGTRIAKRTEPLRIDRGVLSVRVSSAAWANELSFLSSDILAQLRERNVAIDALRFVVGKVTPREERVEPTRFAPPPNPPLPPRLKELCSQISDERLRNAPAAAAAKTLSIPR